MGKHWRVSFSIFLPSSFPQGHWVSGFPLKIKFPPKKQPINSQIPPRCPAAADIPPVFKLITKCKPSPVDTGRRVRQAKVKRQRRRRLGVAQTARVAKKRPVREKQG